MNRQNNSNIFGSPQDSAKFQNDLNSFNLNTSHPLITNSQEYIFYKKYVSIHSQDRDTTKYPNSSEFEIELPEDIVNVSSLTLVNWSFPSNYNVFSSDNSNIVLAFKVVNPYNPGEHGLSDDYNYRIYQALFETQNIDYIFTIEEGFYNPNQITTELTNKFNYIVSRRIVEYFTEKHIAYPLDGWDTTLQLFETRGGYKRFIVVYNNVSAKIWFGNTTDSFIIVNQLSTILNAADILGNCYGRERLPDSTVWGLPNNLGLPRCNTSSVSSSKLSNRDNFEIYKGITVPRFYYGNVTPGDDGFWLLPDPEFPSSEVHWVEGVYKINLMGEAYMYMEIAGQNCIDETQPYNNSEFTLTTNQTNGIVNSSFAKLGIPTTPLSQWFDHMSLPYKTYYPPAERIRRLKIRIRYHDGRSVNFGIFNYSFMLQFTIMVPQILRSSNSVVYPPLQF